MSKNNDLINILINIKHKSVSKTDKKYNEVFKEFNVDTLIKHNNFAKQVRKKWLNNDEYDSSVKSKLITTNDKLNQIINKNRNALKIQDIFFRTYAKEPLFKKINKKDHEKVKTNNNNISLKIRNIIENRKKFNISQTFLKRRYEENNRKPPICLYSPKYSCIYKHVPGFNFKKEKTTSRKKLINIDINSQINSSRESNNYLDENEYKFNNNKNNNSKIFKNKNNVLTPLHISKKRVQLSFIDDNSKEKDKESEDNKDNKNNSPLNKYTKSFFISQQGTPLNNEREKKLPVSSSSKIIKKKVFAPNFDKMMPRFLEKTKKSAFLSNADYSPNYNAIFSGVLDNKPVDLERRKKYYNLKKIIAIFNPTSEYLLFPELNNKV